MPAVSISWVPRAGQRVQRRGDPCDERGDGRRVEDTGYEDLVGACGDVGGDGYVDCGDRALQTSPSSLRPETDLLYERPGGEDRAVDAPEMINAGDLVLKRWQPAWAEELTKAVRASVPELVPFMPWAYDGYDLEDSRAFLEVAENQWEEGMAFEYAVFTAAGDLVGSCGLMTRMGPGVLEIGYWVHRDYTGRGYATALSKALARVALAMPGIDRVVIKHDVANPASGRVAAKVGFTEVERVERDPAAPGESGLVVIWERRQRL